MRHRYYAKPTAFTDSIVILSITEDSIKRLEPYYGRWPWPRSIYAEMVDELAAHGAKAIGLDIIFAEQSLRAEIDSRQLSELQALSVNADVPEIRKDLTARLDTLRPESSDGLFASAVEKAGTVFLASVFYADAQDVVRNPGVEASGHDAVKIQSALSKSMVSLPAGPAHLKTFFNATVPFPELAKAPAGIGHINLFPDSDGTARRFLPAAVFNNKAYLSFPLKIAAFALGVPADEIKISKAGVSIGGAVMPLLADGSAFIPYQGGRIIKHREAGDAYEPFYRYIAYHDLIASKDLRESGQEPLLPDNTFKDKIVLVTIAAAGLSDLRATPFSPVSPGVEIHANIIDALLSKRYLKTVNPTLEKIYIFLLALTIALITRFTGPFGVLVVSGIAASVLGVHWAYFGHGLILPVVGPLVAMTVTYLSVLLLKYAVERREKSYIKKAFGHYIAPAVLEEILKSPESLRLSGERRYMTVLFSDIEGFTTLSGRLPPEEVGHILNDHMNRMVECIQQTGGTVDKFIGDNVMAMWNAPAEQEDHAARACETALLMLDALKKRGKRMQEKGIFLNIRVGVNTGEMVVGNMGSKEIFDYTVIGNEVNLCSRLEAVNKDFGTRIAVSESSYNEVKRHHPDKFVFRRMARILLKGSATPLNVRELTGWRSSFDNGRLDAIEKYEKGFDLFMERRLPEAEKLFREAIEDDRSDALSKTYLSLIEHYKENPLPPDWDGTYVQRTK
ncbi:MAG: adenylate/guanylate cyclase domain-containing protein [Deltaproteobacteria bacterium]|nr:adenylate/guanylate cyclase domain-containing protein [Deltaproteobacteria bacterium]